MIVFLTAHRAKGSEWQRVFVIDTDNFPHPKAQSARQLHQEQNLMYVAVTRAKDALYFVDAPFVCLTLAEDTPVLPLIPQAQAQATRFL